MFKKSRLFREIVHQTEKTIGNILHFYPPRQLTEKVKTIFKRIA